MSSTPVSTAYRTAIIVLTFAASLSAANAKIRSQGEVALSARSFSPDDNADTYDHGLAASFNLDVKAKQKGGFRQQLRLTGRTASIDRERSVLIVNVAGVGWRNTRLQLSIGAETLIGARRKPSILRTPSIVAT